MNLIWGVGAYGRGGEGVVRYAGRRRSAACDEASGRISDILSSGCLMSYLCGWSGLEGEVVGSAEGIIRAHQN